MLAGDSEWWVPIEIRLFRPRAPLSEAAEALWTVVSSQRGSYLRANQDDRNARNAPDLGLHLSTQQNQRRQSEKNKESTGIRDSGQQHA